MSLSLPRVTHLMVECDACGRRVGGDAAGEVHVPALLDAGRVKAAPDGEAHDGWICVDGE